MYIYLAAVAAIVDFFLRRYHSSCMLRYGHLASMRYMRGLHASQSLVERRARAVFRVLGQCGVKR